MSEIQLTPSQEVSLICQMTGKFPTKYDTPSWSLFLTKNMTLLGKYVTEEILPQLPTSKAEVVKNVALAMTPQTPVQVSQSGFRATRAWFNDLTGMHQKKAARAHEKLLHELIMPETPGVIFSLSNKCIGAFKSTCRFIRHQDGKLEFLFKDISAEGNVWVRRAATSSNSIFESAPASLIDKYNMSLLYADQDCAVDIIDPSTGEWKMNQSYASIVAPKVDAIMESELIDADIKQDLRKYIDKYLDRLQTEYCGGNIQSNFAAAVSNPIEARKRLNDRLMMSSVLAMHGPMPKLMTNDPKVPAFAYFDLTKLSDGPTPAFDGFMTAFVTSDEAETFKAYVYACIDEHFKPSQYLWIKGPGGNGKSCFLKALYEYLGDHMCASLSVTSLSSDFGLENLVDKRVVLMPDIQSGLSVKSGCFHNLTGGDPVDINRKGRAHITAILNPLTFIASNYAPNVNMDNSNERRRLLLVRMDQPSEEVQQRIYQTDSNGDIVLDDQGNKILVGFDLEAALIDEMPHILYKCRESYNKKVSKYRTSICPTPDEVGMYYDYCQDTESDAIDEVLRELVTVTKDENDTITSTDLYNLVLAELNRKSIKTSNFTTTTISRKLSAIDGVKLKRTRKDGFKTTLYTGIKEA